MQNRLYDIVSKFTIPILTEAQRQQKSWPIVKSYRMFVGDSSLIDKSKQICLVNKDLQSGNTENSLHIA
jgi:hypothetical protein